MEAPIYDVGSMWELVERRAAGIARSSHAHRRGRPDRMTFGEFEQRCEAVAAGLHDMGVRPRTGRCRGSCPPASRRSCCRWRWPGWGWCRTPSSTSTASARWPSPCARPAPRSSSSPACGRTSTSSPWPTRSAPGSTRPADRGRGLRPLPEGDPARFLPPPPGPSGGRRGALDLLHLGHDLGPEGRAPHRHHPRHRRAGGWPWPCDMGEEDVGSIAFPFAHIAGPDYLVMVLAIGFPPCCSSRSCPHWPWRSSAATASPWPVGAPPSTRRT